MRVCVCIYIYIYNTDTHTHLIMYTCVWNVFLLFSGPWSKRLMASADKILDTVCVLYKSNNYLIINKQYDILINSDDPEQLLTVENQLRKMYPELVDDTVKHGFRSVLSQDYVLVTTTVVSVLFRRKAFTSLTRVYLSIVFSQADSYIQLSEMSIR